MCIREVISANQRGKDGVAHLVSAGIPRQKAIIEEIMSLVGGTSGDDEDQPPQKKLVLRRR